MTTTTALLGRGLAALVVLSLTPGRPALAQAPQTDDDWCSRVSSDRQATFCEVREERLSGLPARVDVDGGQNGGVSVEAWDRPEVLVRVRIVGVADTDAEARQIAAEVGVTTDGGGVRANGPSRGGGRQSWGGRRGPGGGGFPPAWAEPGPRRVGRVPDPRRDRPVSTCNAVIVMSCNMNWTSW